MQTLTILKQTGYRKPSTKANNGLYSVRDIAEKFGYSESYTRKALLKASIKPAVEVVKSGACGKVHVMLYNLKQVQALTSRTI